MPIPLSNALLCLDCDCVVESQTDRCPVCASIALLPLANALGVMDRELVRVSSPQGEENPVNKEVAEICQSTRGWSGLSPLL